MEMLWGQIWNLLSFADWKKGIGIKIAYVLVHQADILLTNAALNAGFKEYNPLISAMIDTPFQLLVVKVLIPILIAWLVPARLLIPALVLLLIVIALNLAQFSLPL